ncbi:sigma 54-interacting transcriptional regulator [Acidobacteriota bacterium]
MAKKNKIKVDLTQIIKAIETKHGPGTFWTKVLNSVDIPLFIMDADRKVLYWSNGAAKFTGFSVEEMLGQNCCEGDKCDNCLTECELFSLGEVKDRETILYRKDGSERPIRKSGILLKDEKGKTLFGVEMFQDINEEVLTRQKWQRARVQVESNKKIVESLINSISDGAVGIDNNFEIVSFSRQASEITGISMDEAIGQNCYEILKNPLCSEQCPVQELFKTGKLRHEAQTRFRLPSGETVGVIECAVPLLQEGQQQGSVLILKDQSIKEMLGRELLQQNRFGELIGRSKAMQDIFYLIDKISDIDVPVLIEGERGSGRAVIAQTIHRNSPRSDGPFRSVDCGLLPAKYMESELFGHLAGSVEGAVRDRIGQIELVDRGTLCIVRIGQLPAKVQSKLLKLLKEGVIERVGGTQKIPVDVRLIAATDCNLEEMTIDGSFNRELYSRLKAITVTIPPLRERIADIEILTAHFLYTLATATEGGDEPKKVSAAALRALIRYDWPGNVRDLQNVLEYAVSVCSGNTINLSDLPPQVLSSTIPKVESDDEDERTRILKVLEECHWRRNEVAQRLHMDRTTLWRKMKAYGLG